ncbi:MAG TPA: nucleoside-diphosphate sugar epimerase/dehydratase, partial [Ramlibacter sp.]|nr:nucleoside-diphosphate sugar epimerase/dehydratase [Ramlibacter sp.]
MRLRRDPLLLLGVDLALVLLAGWGAFWLRFNFDVPPEYARLAALATPWSLGGYALALVLSRVYRQVWSYIGLPELRQLATGILLGGLLTGAAILMLRMPDFPRSVLLLQPVLALLFLGAARAAWRTLAEHRTLAQGGRRLVIVGPLQDAADALRALKGSQQWQPVGIVSPLRSEVGRSMQNVPVLGQTAALAAICETAQADAALIASPPGSPERQQALASAAGSRVNMLTMPRPDEWLKTDAPGPRRIQLEDLLGRTPVQLDVAGLADLFSGQTVLVTGAGGSIGSELCRQVARFGVRSLVCADVSEFAIYQLEQELRAAHPQMQASYYTANVREGDRLRAIALKHRPAVVLHAAAYKHVPLMEELNEIEALRTNVQGTLHAARIAGDCGARRFVLISTDKAVNPTNVMGASKRLAELVVQRTATEYLQTQYVSVRFGNVLGSSGSVVPLFTSQIDRGGPVTVTHPEIVRYFMTIPEAAQLVLQAGLMGSSGQIFVLDMGEPVKIAELARMLIRLKGKTEQEIPVTYIGLRPGEKLFEELLANDETTQPTPHPKLRVAKTNGARTDVAAILQWISEAGPAPGAHVLRQWLRSQVPE